MVMQVTVWVLLYLGLGMGFAIGVLFDEKRCPKDGGELFLYWIFWLPIIFGYFYSKMWINIMKSPAK